jgi:SAM-dependent methyltransferase
MQLVLDPAHLRAAHTALTGARSDQLIELMFRLNLGRPVDGVPADAMDLARELGWIDAHTKLTSLGGLVADPIREYRFWLERDRRLHSERDHELLAKEAYRGKAVLEIGSGFGCNLFSMAGMPGRFVGVEPVALYRQFTPILAQREGIEAPVIVDGRGEELPFATGEFDIVLIYSAHQYMDIKPALKEMARVLKPGGQLQIVGATTTRSFGMVGRALMSGRLGTAKYHGLAVLNTVAYCALGRRVYVPAGFSATTAPIYPPRWLLAKWMGEASLKFRDDWSRPLMSDHCFIGERFERSGGVAST